MKHGCLRSLGILGSVFICLWVVCTIWHRRYAREFLDPNQEWRFLGEWKAYKYCSPPIKYERFGAVGATFRADGTCTLRGFEDGTYPNLHFNTNAMEATWRIFIDTNRWERRLWLYDLEGKMIHDTQWEPDHDGDFYILWFSDEAKVCSVLYKEPLNVPVQEKKHLPW